MFFSLIIFAGIIAAIFFTVMFLVRMYESIQNIKNTLSEKEKLDKELQQEIEDRLEKATDFENIQALESKIETIKSMAEDSKDKLNSLSDKQVDLIVNKVNQMQSTNEEKMLTILEDIGKDMVNEIQILSQNHENLDERLKLIEESMKNDEDTFETWESFVNNTDDDVKLLESDVNVRSMTNKAKSAISDYAIDYDLSMRNKNKN